MRILFALLALGIGGALLLAGYRLARYIIPLWGFLAGMAIGGDVISHLASTPFLGTALGILVGIGLGLLFAVLAYLYYSIAVIILVGATGYWLGSNFIMLFGFDPGFLSVTVGAALGVIFGILALLYNAPKYVLIVITAVAGAMAAIGGVLLLFNQVPLDNFTYSAVSHAVSHSFIWSLLALLLAGASIAWQVVTTLRYSFETWALNGWGEDNLPTHTTHVHHGH